MAKVCQNRVARFIPTGFAVAAHVVPRPVTLWIVGPFVELSGRPERQAGYRFTVAFPHFQILLRRFFGRGMRRHGEPIVQAKVGTDAYDEDALASLRYSVVTSVEHRPGEVVARLNRTKGILLSVEPPPAL